MIFPNIYGVIYVVKSKVAFQIKTVGTKLQILQFLTVVSVRSVDEIKPVSHFWLWAVSTLLAPPPPPPQPPLPFLSGWRQPPSELTSLRRGGGWRSAAIKKRCEDAKHPEASNLQRGASLSCQVSIWVRSGKNSFQFGNCISPHWEMKLSALRSWRQWEWVGSKSRGSFHFRGNLWEYSENFTLRRLPVDQIQNSKSSVCIFLRWSSQTNFWVIESVNVMKNANGLHQLCKASGMVVQERIEEKFKMF